MGFDGVSQAEIRDEENYGKVKKYESKIDTLMSEAGELQSQLDLQKVRADAERFVVERVGILRLLTLV